MKYLLFIFVVTFCSQQAFALPATTVPVQETDQYVPFAHKPKGWFIRLDADSDVGFRGTQGIGVAVGYYKKFFFYDFTGNFYKTQYGAVKVYDNTDSADTDAIFTGTPVQSLADSDSGKLLTFGPGIGFIEHLFGGKDWVGMGRFGLNMAIYRDATMAESFVGGLANMQGSIGYDTTVGILSAGLTWNLGYLHQTPATSVYVNSNALPMQWWAFQISLLTWIN
jgi:hypothetical protein